MSSHEIQLSRDQFGRLPHLSNWSRHEPASLKKTHHTDHWSKSKHKTVTLFTTDANGKTNFYPGEKLQTENLPKGEELTITPHHRVDGVMKHIGTKSFTEMLFEELNGHLPGSNTVKKEPSKLFLKTNANERARDNFEYWYKEPEPLKHSCKKWIGQGGNVLGTTQR